MFSFERSISKRLRTNRTAIISFHKILATVSSQAFKAFIKYVLVAWSVVTLVITSRVHLVGVLLRVRVGFPGEADGARAPRAAAARLLANVVDWERPRGHVTRGRPRGHRPGHSLHHHLVRAACKPTH